MKLKFVLLTLLIAVAWPGLAQDKPLRVFIRASKKTHGPGEHDYPRFLAEWRKLLRQRGAEVEGALSFPSKRQLDHTDVLVLYCSEGSSVSSEERASLEAFARRGGGLVALHDAICGTNAAWFKTLFGGAKQHGETNWSKGLLGLYFQDYRHPITEGVANFDLDDELFFRLDMMPETKVLAATFRTAKEIVPQMWVYENANSRAFVALQGHNYATFDLPHYRGLILRGIAWAGKRPVDSLLRQDEFAHFRYPPGGPTRPEAAAKKIKVQPEFDLSLVAAEPMVVNPISLDWDARGRMWVVVTPEYPFKTDTSPPKDAILILEDTDGDGRMDKRHVFYEGLTLPTSLVFHRDGVIVAQAPQILWLRDTDGDGAADRKEVLFDGFGTHDTHAVISNLRWGLDGWVYATQGYSGNDSTNVVGASGRSFGKVGNGVLRFKPDGSAIEVVTSFSGNTWGLDFSWDGELFFSKANGPHVSHVVLPERFLARARMTNTTSDKAIEDHEKVFPAFTDTRHEYVQVAPVGVFTGASGALVYEGGSWPEKYHGSFFVCEPTVHIVHEDLLGREEGVNYDATRRQEEEFIAGTDLWFRPVHLRAGPDGAIYLLDFYNQAISHNDIRGIAHGAGNAAVRPDRDHLHGRIWRLQHKWARPIVVPALHQATPPELVKALEHPNAWARLTAQRLLLERGDTAVAPALAFMLQSNRLAHARVHAAWCLSHLQALTETNLIGAIKDPHPAVQRNALRVVEERGGPVSAALEKAVVAQFKDTDARVRLAALAAASQSPLSKEGKHAVLKAFNEAKDGWSRSAVLGAARNAPLDFIDDAFNKPDDYKELVAFIIEGLAQQKQTELAADVIRMVARKPKEANKLRAAILEAFAKQLPDGFAPAWSEDVAKALKKLLEVESRTVRVAALPLAMHYESAEGAALDTAEVRKEVLGYLRGERLKDDQRTPYITGILAAPSLWPDGIDLADKWLAAGASKELQKDIVTQLGRTTAPAAGQTLVKNLKRLNTANRQLAVAALLKREEWALTLVEGIENETVSLNDVGVQGVDRLRVHPDKAVAERANRVLDAVQGPLLTEKDALIARFQRTLQTPGSARKGKELFQQNCGICHKFGRDGKDLGPELTGVGLHGAAVLLVHILDPNRVVEGNYVPYYLTTKKDEEYYGLLARENTESVVLRGVEGETEVRRSDIADLRSAARSIMPDGLESLGEQGIRDIIAFMTENTPRGFRTLDLSGAFTSDSRKGLYADPSDPPPLTFRKYGIVMVENVPFHVVSPTTAPGGRNVIVLRGGRGFAKTLPQRVEIPVGVQAKRIHILGGIAGWGYPEGDPSGYNAPAAKARILYADGKIEDVLWRNGEEFADCAGREEVSGSVQVPGLVEKGQVRWFALTPGQPVEIRKIVLESFNNHLAPTFIAMTAQVEE